MQEKNSDFLRRAHARIKPVRKASIVNRRRAIGGFGNLGMEQASFPSPFRRSVISPCVLACDGPERSSLFSWRLNRSYHSRFPKGLCDETESIRRGGRSILKYLPPAARASSVSLAGSCHLNRTHFRVGCIGIQALRTARLDELLHSKLGGPSIQRRKLSISCGVPMVIGRGFGSRALFAPSRIPRTLSRGGFAGPHKWP